MKKILQNNIALIISVIFLLILIFIPTNYKTNAAYSGKEEVKCEVLSVDNSMIRSYGVIQSGEQKCEIKILGGSHKGEIVEGINLLTGSLAEDKIFKAGDKALVMIATDDGNIISVSMIDHYRINYEIILVLIFTAVLIVFAGKIGLKSILSFIISILCIWKIIIPGYLDGLNPIWLGIAILIVLTTIIEVFVFGFNKKSFAAIFGSMLGIATTCILGIIFTNLFKIHGAVMPNSEQLLYCGYQHLNLTNIYIATIFIGSSGALMDIATDITASMVEIVKQSPDISFKEALKSGLNVGKAAMGTMSTTLLLAYSGSCMALLMVFAAQGTPIINILNYKSVSAELINIIIGSLGLVAVAPFTALTSALFLTKKKHKNLNDASNIN